MSTLAHHIDHVADYPVRVEVEPALDGRNRLTTAFRMVLALPHLILVGGPLAAVLSWTWRSDTGMTYDWGASGGVLGVVAGVGALIAWFAIVFTGRHPNGLWNLTTYYLQWRVRAVAYTALLCDEYPPFGETAQYPAMLDLPMPVTRDRVSVAFRLFLAIPQIIVVWLLSIAWACTTVIAWFAILLTGSYPARLYEFGVGVLRWNVRVEAYLLLLRDEYPPFSFE